MSEQARLSAILETMIAVTRAAGQQVLPMFEVGCASATKADGSLVTEADTLGEALIGEALRAAYPNVAMLGEEAVAAGAVPDLSGPYFCLDPIDGTQQFATHSREWVIALAYVEGGRPLAGVILAPALDHRLFAGLSDFGGFEIKGDGARIPFPRPNEPIATRPLHILQGGNDSAASLQAHLPSGVPFELRQVSSALKFGLIAVGEADLFVRAGQVWDWDIAAGQAIVEAAGGRLLDVQGQHLRYGQAQNRYRHPPFVARGARAIGFDT